MYTFNQVNMETQLARARHRGDALSCVAEITNSFLKFVQTMMLTWFPLSDPPRGRWFFWWISHTPLINSTSSNSFWMVIIEPDIPELMAVMLHPWDCDCSVKCKKKCLGHDGLDQDSRGKWKGMLLDYRSSRSLVFISTSMMELLDIICDLDQ